MAKTFLESTTFYHNFQAYSVENMQKSLEAERAKAFAGIKQADEMLEDLDIDQETAERIKGQKTACRTTLMANQLHRKLLEKYPDEFPALYSVMERSADENVKMEFKETLAPESEIVTEAQDILEKDEQLELACELDDGNRFSVAVERYDQAGEDEPQLKARIHFTDQAIDELNESRLKQILEFCEKHGFSVYDIDLPMKDGVIDLDEKLAVLTRQILEDRQAQAAQNEFTPAEEVMDEDMNIINPVIDEISIDSPEILQKNTKKETAKAKSLKNVCDSLREYLEKDLHKTRNLSYFEHTKMVGGKSMVVFSLYDKPNPDNEKQDGLKDKNGVYVPTYTARLYVSQDAVTGKFTFGYSMPNGKAMSNDLAGDFIGLIKDTGATHINFSGLANADKGVWMMACAEKGIVPIGISLNMAKVKAMVDAATKKLPTEQLILFKRRLADQVIENAQKKKPDAENYGLSKSEMDYLSSLRDAYEFENFRLAYEASDRGLYAKTNAMITEGGRNNKEGAAITFGAMQNLRTVFDIYNNHQHQTFGAFLEGDDYHAKALTAEERQKLGAIPGNKRMLDLDTNDFALIYDTLLPRHIENAKQDILNAIIRETKRKGAKRADNVVLAADLFPKYKGAVTKINTILVRDRGLDSLTLPTEHSGLDFERPANLVPENTPTQTAAPTNTAQNTPNEAAVAQRAGQNTR